ncbi:hypothetical protein ACTXT7_012879 [Hymenolepis weldensis]
MQAIDEVQDHMADTTISNEMKGHAAVELLNEENGDKLPSSRKRKEHRQRSANSLTHSLTTAEFVRSMHGMMDENREKSMHDILPKIFECLMEQ